MSNCLFVIQLLNFQLQAGIVINTESKKGRHIAWHFTRSVASNCLRKLKNQLKDQILAGKWKPGERLPSENELAEIFQVSRVSIRQALQALSAQGLIETRIGDGFLHQPAHHRYLYAGRDPGCVSGRRFSAGRAGIPPGFEGPVAELAATRATDEQISQLAVLYHQMWEHADDADKNSYYDLSFHMLIGEMTGNPMITGVYRILNSVLRSSSVTLGSPPQWSLNKLSLSTKASSSLPPEKTRSSAGKSWRSMWPIAGSFSSATRSRPTAPGRIRPSPEFYRHFQHEAASFAPAALHFKKTTGARSSGNGLLFFRFSAGK